MFASSYAFGKVQYNFLYTWLFSSQCYGIECDGVLLSIEWLAKGNAEN